MKKQTIIFLFILLTPWFLSAQRIYGEFVGFYDTLHLNTNRTAELNERKGTLRDSLVIFDKDTFVLIRYKETDYYALPTLEFIRAIQDTSTCHSGSFRSYFLKKEYWPNGNVKEDRDIIYRHGKGFLVHGTTTRYNEDGTAREVLKYRKGKQR